MTAYRIWIARGGPEERTAEAVVGEALEAEAQANLGVIVKMLGKRWSE